MLNYNELNEKFTHKLNSFTKEQLLKWIDFDQDRDTISKLVCGESVSVRNTTSKQTILSDNKECIIPITGDISYAMAA